MRSKLQKVSDEDVKEHDLEECEVALAYVEDACLRLKNYLRKLDTHRKTDEKEPSIQSIRLRGDVRDIEKQINDIRQESLTEKE